MISYDSYITTTTKYDNIYKCTDIGQKFVLVDTVNAVFCALYIENLKRHHQFDVQYYWSSFGTLKDSMQSNVVFNGML